MKPLPIASCKQLVAVISQKQTSVMDLLCEGLQR